MDDSPHSRRRPADKHFRERQWSRNFAGKPPEDFQPWIHHHRKDGHGFGLHSGALAARELGGSLKVDSEGPGLGATINLELPLEGKGCAG
jgi:hypothetical protein